MKKIIGVGLGLLVLAGIVGLFLPTPTPTPTTPESPALSPVETVDPVSDHSKLQVYAFAEREVRARLKDPDSATFAASTEKLSQVLYVGDFQYDVHSTVRSRNGFGGMGLTRFSARVYYDGKEMAVSDVRFY